MPTATPPITIGMPVYNGAAYVEEAIRSLLDQSESNFVLHIADDGSTDGTPAICRRLAEEDARISFEQHPYNLGMTRNFQHLLDAARSPYFLWAAQDDRWDPDFLHAGMQALAERPEAIAWMPGVQLEDEDGAVRTIVHPPRGLASPDPVLRARAVHQGGYHAIYALYRRDVLLAGPTLEDIAGTDIAFVFAMALHGRFAVDLVVRSFRRVLGYHLVVGRDGRPTAAKALGASGHLYTRNPNRMCASMIRATLDAPLSGIQKSALLLHVGLRWWLLRWRWLLWSDATTRAKRSVGRYPAVDRAVRSTRRAWQTVVSSSRGQRP